jgi:hypothetical protein
MKINTKLVKTVQKIWNKDWVNPGLNLELTDDQAECLTKTLIQWKAYHELNQNNREKNQ